MAAVVDVCPNCGAPLELAPDGTCSFCHAHVRLARPGGAGGPAEDTGITLADEQLPAPAGRTLLIMRYSAPQGAFAGLLAEAEGAAWLAQLIAALRAVGEAGRSQPRETTSTGMVREAEQINCGAAWTPPQQWVLRLAVLVISRAADDPELPPGLRDNLRRVAVNDFDYFGSDWALLDRVIGRKPEGLAALEAWAVDGATARQRMDERRGVSGPEVSQDQADALPDAIGLPLAALVRLRGSGLLATLCRQPGVALGLDQLAAALMAAGERVNLDPGYQKSDNQHAAAADRLSAEEIWAMALLTDLLVVLASATRDGEGDQATRAVDYVRTVFGKKLKKAVKKVKPPTVELAQVREFVAIT